MVSTDQAHAIRVANLECKQKQEGFDRVEAPINEVTHEQVVSARAFATDLK